MKLSEYKEKFSSCTCIGKGGQKTVYKVDDTLNNCNYALKIVEAPNDPRIQQEIAILRSVDIQGVPHILDYGMVEDDISKDILLYILEEYIEGESLRTILIREKNVSTKIAIIILERLLDIETQLEERAILHRDIKPDNIIIGRNDAVYLIDFGIAKILGESSLTRTAAQNGPCTPAYAPIELATNMKRHQDVRIDLYQIGLTVYESLIGYNPFSNGAKNQQEVFARGKTIMPPSIQIPGDTQGLLMQYISMLIAKNPSQRPNSAKDAKRYYDAIRSTINIGR